MKELQKMVKYLEEQMHFIDEPKRNLFKKLFNITEDIDDYFIVIPEELKDKFNCLYLPRYIVFDKYTDRVYAIKIKKLTKE